MVDGICGQCWTSYPTLCETNAKSHRAFLRRLQEDKEPVPEVQVVIQERARYWSYLPILVEAAGWVVLLVLLL